MKLQLPVLSPKGSLKGKRIFLRVDWNVPLHSELSGAESLKLSRSIETVKSLAARGAIVIAATHLGRPKKRDTSLSTKQLIHVMALHHEVKMQFLSEDLESNNGLASAQKKVGDAKPGTIFLLENVRFYAGEEKNTPTLAKAFASLADLFVNDAFASCHRAHASVVGVPKYLPHYAGPTLVDEWKAIERLITAPKKPFIAVIGGAKLSTKIPALEVLVKKADQIFIGGAMANVFLAAQKKQIGKSYIEKEAIPLAKKLLKNKNIHLPVDVVVASKIAPNAKVRVAKVTEVKKTEMIGDIGPETMRTWAAEINNAKTIVWNGSLGVAEIPTFSHGSLVVARVIAARSKGKAYGVVGGGDTLAVALASGMAEWYDYLATGGGAMLTCIVTKGALPGFVALQKKNI